MPVEGVSEPMRRPYGLSFSLLGIVRLYFSSMKYFKTNIIRGFCFQSLSWPWRYRTEGGSPTDQNTSSCSPLAPGSWESQSCPLHLPQPQRHRCVLLPFHEDANLHICEWWTSVLEILSSLLESWKCSCLKMFQYSGNISEFVDSFINGQSKKISRLTWFNIFVKPPLFHYFQLHTRLTFHTWKDTLIIPNHVRTQMSQRAICL